MGSLPSTSPALQTQETLRRWLRGLPLATAVGVLLILCAGIGFVVPYVNPLLLYGGIIALGFVLLILANPFIGLIAYTATYMLRPGEIVPAIEPLHVERLVGLLGLGSLLLSQLLRDRSIHLDKSRQSKLFLFLLVAVLLSVPGSYWMSKSVEGLVDFLKIGVFYILVVQLITSRQRLKIFLWVYCASIAYDAAQSVNDYFHGTNLHAQGIDRAIGRTGGEGANELGATMAATIPIFLLLALRKGSGRWRIFYAAVFLLLLMTLAFTGSRSAFLGFLVSLGYVWWNSRQKLLFGALGLLFLGAGILALPEQYKERYTTILESAESTENLDDSSKLRLVIWGAGLRMMAARPISGVGIGCYGVANGMEFSPPGRNNWMEAHSLYIQVPAEMGFIGAIAFFWFVIHMLRFNRRTARELEAEGDEWEFERVFLNAMFAATLALLMSGVFGHSLTRRTWYLYAALGVVVHRVYVFERIKRLGVR